MRFSMLLCFLAVTWCAIATEQVHAAKPNIVYILLDDAGYDAVLKEEEANG